MYFFDINIEKQFSLCNLPSNASHTFSDISKNSRSNWQKFHIKLFLAREKFNNVLNDSFNMISRLISGNIFRNKQNVSVRQNFSLSVKMAFLKLFIVVMR